MKQLRKLIFDRCYTLLMYKAGGRGGRTPYDREELRLVHEALRSQRLFRWQGTMTSNFEKEFARLYGVSHAVASTSGTAAIHVALGTLDLDAGDEVITTPITDMGTVIPILSQNAIPVFADIDDSYNISPQAIERCITERTKAIIVVHCFGNPADMDAITAISRRHNIPVIEDCSHTHVTQYQGRYVGTIGDMGCFSFQESKHMTTGDGGMTITDNPAYRERMELFADKGFDRKSADPAAYRFLAPNYRMMELTAAVGRAQLKKVQSVVKRRNELGTLMTELLSGLGGVRTAPVTADSTHAYWTYPLYVEARDVEDFISAMKQKGLSVSGHMSTPVYLLSEVFTAKRTYGKSECPYSCSGREYEYAPGLCPEAERLSRHLANFWINEGWGESGVRKVAEAVKSYLGGAG